MIKFGQAYYLSNDQIRSYQGNKTEKDAVDTPDSIPTKTELNIARGEESRQQTEPENGGETYAEAVLRGGGDVSTYADVAQYLAAYESVYGVDLNRQASEADENRDTRTRYGIAELSALGITDDIINTYFDRETLSGKYGSYESYLLKNDIVIDGKAITSIEELVKALGIKND